MKSRATPDFWSHYNRLPSRIQKSAKQAYARFRQNPNHPSLRLKKVHTSQEIYSVRVSYQSPSQSSQIPACAESPHSLPSPPLSKGERVGVRGDSSPVHSRTLAAQLV